MEQEIEMASMSSSNEPGLIVDLISENKSINGYTKTLNIIREQRYPITNWGMYKVYT